MRLPPAILAAALAFGCTPSGAAVADALTAGGWVQVSDPFPLRPGCVLVRALHRRTAPDAVLVLHDLEVCCRGDARSVREH